jgi:hypothetical protein
MNEHLLFSETNIFLRSLLLRKYSGVHFGSHSNVSIPSRIIRVFRRLGTNLLPPFSERSDQFQMNSKVVWRGKMVRTAANQGYGRATGDRSCALQTLVLQCAITLITINNLRFPPPPRNYV